jgi:xylulokinase
MDITSPQPGWAEQDPQQWWDNLIAATRSVIASAGIAGGDIHGIGISYQMHGLVVVDAQQQVIRPAIIWCDSRAVAVGDAAFAALGEDTCLQRLLNSPGNFTASKLKWLRDNEPDNFKRVDKFLLPGDYIALRLTGEACTTVPGLSEAVLWDFRDQAPCRLLLEHFGIDRELVPELRDTFSVQGELTRAAADSLGLRPGIPVGYRAGDQPNNAMSLGVLEPGQMAGTGGTSGVLYGISATPPIDPSGAVNSFAHVNHRAASPRIGALLCINGCGSQHRWIKQQIAPADTSYQQLEAIIAAVPVGAGRLRMLPFGNGAERMLGNRELGARLLGLDFNRHSQAHLCRAALEGIAFAFVHGAQRLHDLGLELHMLRVGNDNLFQSAVFGATVATLTGATIEMVATTGAVGAARAAGVTSGHFASLAEAMSSDPVIRTYHPQASPEPYREAYTRWSTDLTQALQQTEVP